MKKVISVRFKENGKSYYFDPAGADIKTGEYVIVETARGVECGEVVQGVREIADAAVPKALKPITRMADSVDIRRMRQNREDEKRAYRTCQECIARHGLEMKLVEAEYTLDRSKIMFYFTADGRVDFRELVKDLAGIFHTRIELRQIGVRDESKMIGGLGICGQPFCCSRFLKDFQPVAGDALLTGAVGALLVLPVLAHPANIHAVGHPGDGLEGLGHGGVGNLLHALHHLAALHAPGRLDDDVIAGLDGGVCGVKIIGLAVVLETDGYNFFHSIPLWGRI